MRRVIVIAWMLLIPIADTARAQLIGAAGVSSAASTLVQPATVEAPAREGVVVPSAGFQLRQVAPPPIVPRRRASMVGYIEDPVVSSKVRVRFEVGLHDTTPDRAEFFYAKCGCYRDLPTNHEAYDPHAAGPGPGAASDVNFSQLYVQGEYAASDFFSVFAELPTRWLRPQSFIPGTGGSFSNQTGMSDLRAGAKLAVVATPEQVVTVQARLFLPTGDALKGLGTDHASVEPAFLFYQQASDRVAVEGQVSTWIPIGGSAPVPVSGEGNFSGTVFSYGIGPSFEVYRSGSVRFAPVVELVGWRVLEGYQTGTDDPKAKGTNIVNLKIGARTSWGPGGSLYFGYGHALTDAAWYDEIVRFEYRYSF